MAKIQAGLSLLKIRAWQRFIEVARVMAGLELGMEESKRIVTEFRYSNPLIVNLWYRLHDGCGSEVDGS